MLGSTQAHTRRTARQDEHTMISQPHGVHAVEAVAHPVYGRPVANRVILTPIAFQLSLGPITAAALFATLGLTYGGPHWPSCGARLVATDPGELELWWTKEDRSLDSSNQFVTGCSYDDVVEIAVSPLHRFFHHISSGRWWAPKFTDDEMSRVDHCALAQQGQIRIDRFLQTTTWYQLLGASVDYLAWVLLWMGMRVMSNLIAAAEANHAPAPDHPVYYGVCAVLIASATLFLLNSSTFWRLPYYLLGACYPVVLCVQYVSRLL